MHAKAESSINFSVAGVSGQVRATKSAWGNSAANSSGGWTASAEPGVVVGLRLVASTCMSNALASLAQPRADLPQTDDQQGLAAQFILALRQVTDHAAPDMALLAIPTGVDVARQGQDQSHGMFTDCVGC